ncbi:hypothetical protein HRbin29_01104 [bacterium HR29]|jgi:flagellar hook assembly protein FlgD|nr:hypothetical protein HRbin29_01104 [bacterium HR29]
MSTFQVDPVTALRNATYQPSNGVSEQGIDQVDFLKLIVAQLRNQNPLDPQSDTDFIAQMAQFEALNQMRIVAEGMKAMQGISELTAAAGLIGREVVGRQSVAIDVVRDLVARELFGAPFAQLTSAQREQVNADERVKAAAEDVQNVGREVRGVVDRVVVGPDGVPMLLIGSKVVDLFSVVEVR